MKNTLKSGILILSAALAPLLNSCFKEPTVPVVVTKTVEGVTQNDALVKGSVSTDGGEIVTARGICWSTSPEPTIDKSKILSGEGLGDFTGSLEDLVPGMKYYTRAFAVNNVGTAYGNELVFSTEELADIDGNKYTTIDIGGQIWTEDNMKTTRFNDGTVIPLVPPTNEWLTTTTPGYTWYDGDADAYGETYGALYNWYAVATGKLCPDGWHVPSDEEMASLTDYLGGQNVAGGKLKEAGTTHWKSPNTGATDEVGFTGLPGGYKSPDGIYEYLGEYGNYCTATDSSAIEAYRWYLSFEHKRVFKAASPKNYCFSVRCVKD